MFDHVRDPTYSDVYRRFKSGFRERLVKVLTSRGVFLKSLSWNDCWVVTGRGLANDVS
jgi:hypothetical protein